ncbi:hypothetical protein LSCM1_03800 [Leishmania martiniquensis]|uniref:Uncharacterized protein n=1 Tax=Leishmania martiniquensis TaxID=1580590 RepID=A0A836KFR8_9TRYP|nr:hypothetical protein LSCM1_03800 [Leishmania martiniquensis]
MSQSSLPSSSASECASVPLSDGSGAALHVSPSLPVADDDNTTTTLMATPSVVASFSIDGDGGAGAPPVSSESVRPLAVSLSDSSAVTETMLATNDGPHQAPEALPRLLRQPNIAAKLSRGLSADVGVTEYEGETCALPTTLPASVSLSCDDPESLGVAAPSLPPRASSSSASSTEVSDLPTWQPGAASSLPSAVPAPSPESSALLVSTVAEGEVCHSDISDLSPTGFLSTASDSLSLLSPQETAGETCIAAFGSAETPAREERTHVGIVPYSDVAAASPLIHEGVAPSVGQGAAHSPSPPPTPHVMSANTSEEGKMAVHLPLAGNLEAGVCGCKVPVDVAEAHAALGGLPLTELSCSLSTVAASTNGSDSPTVDGGPASGVSTNATTPPARQSEATEKLTLPDASGSVEIGSGGQDGDQDGLRIAGAAPPATAKAAKAPSASRKRRLVAVAGPNRQPHRAVRRTEGEWKSAEEAESTSPLTTRTEIGKRSASIQVHALAVMSSSLGVREGEGPHEGKKLNVPRRRGEVHGGEAGDDDPGGLAAATEQEGLAAGAQKCEGRSVPDEYGEEAERANDPSPPDATMVVSPGHIDAIGGEQGPLELPPPSPAATGASAATDTTATTPSPVRHLTTEASAPKSSASSAKLKKSTRDAPRAVIKEAGAPAPLSASLKPVLNLAGVNVQALLAGGADPPPLYTRRQRRTRRRSALDEDHPLFAEHRDLWEHDATGRILPRAPFASDADVLSSLTEWTDSPALVYAQLLWRYAPAPFLKLAIRDSDTTPYAKVEPKVEFGTSMKEERME